jgi:hypothetical protein
MVMGGGAENCFAPLATGAAPWAAAPAAVDVEGDAAGFGSGLSALESCAEEGAAADGRVGVGAWAAGVVVWPQAATTTIASVQNARRKRSVKARSRLSVEAGRFPQLDCHNNFH